MNTGIFQTILSSFHHLIWPAVCHCCGKKMIDEKGLLCPECWQGLLQSCSDDYCPKCGIDISRYGLLKVGCSRCQDTVLHFDGISRIGHYSGLFRKMILDYKFKEKTEFVSIFGSLASSTLQGCSFGEEIDVFVPVPLHWRRQLMRGYNQAYLLAKNITECKKKISRKLARIRYTESQWHLTASKRRKNVKGAFAVKKKHPFKDACVCLIDDITTSKATLNECSKILKEAGARRVYAFVLAVAIQEQG